MKLLAKSCVLAAILSLAMTTTAKASHMHNKAISSNDYMKSQSLIIAQKDQPIDLGEESTRQFLDEMIKMHMTMVAMSQNMLKTPDPGIRKMAQEMMDYSNAQIVKLVGERQRLFRVNRR